MTLRRNLLRSLFVCLVVVFLSLTLVYNRLNFYSSGPPIPDGVNLQPSFSQENNAIDKSKDAYHLESSFKDDLHAAPLQLQSPLQSAAKQISPLSQATFIEEMQSEISRLRQRLEEMERKQASFEGHQNGAQLFPPLSSSSSSRHHQQQQGSSNNYQQYMKTKQLPYSEKKRILITGGAGFVGSHLLDRLLLDGHEVIVADNFYTGRRLNIAHWIGHPNFELLHHDIVNPLYVEVDEIYHLASPASPPHYMMNAVKTIKTNTVGTINMLGLAKRVGGRILVASTSEVYGDPTVHPQAETYWGNVNPIGPRSCYDEGKRVAEALTYAYAKQERLEVRVARIFNTYGPRMHVHDGRVVSNFISQALQGRRLSVYGEGRQTRSFQYVTDLVEGLVRLMAANYSQPVNLGNPEETRIADFARIVLDLVHGYAHIEHFPTPVDDPRRRRPDISLAKRTLHGWTPNVTLEEGLVKTIDYFRGELRLSLGQSRNSNGGRSSVET
ncbi:PREDICTED: UDP-glucuronic acid decarboxylase 1-like [Rhagoletis zephyria]|uniref:UDP-glucuronic acid decarboxylase 1-like n=1 Tax=Rhagoletis zephyria TaxID=28612 RepID=UPI000811A073|nr:PREDICTED: UDP-glucuronic acid decarboxylase 1-like [Rhagoletis zephyria]